MFQNVVFLALCMVAVNAFECQDPMPAANFTFSGFEGKWYEVGKIQTPGGAFWQENCVCNTMNVQINDRTTGDSQVAYQCREYTPQGDLTLFEASLIEMRRPGQWRQQVFEFVPTVGWTVLVMGEEYGIQYDCGENLFTTEYCIHIISRKPDLDEEVVKTLVAYAESLDLNPLGLEYGAIEQAGCSHTET